MAVWTPFPSDYAPGVMFPSADYNLYVKGNVNYLMNGRPIGFVNYNAPAQYTMTGLAFADMDAANLIITATVSSGRVYAEAMLGGVAVAAGAGGYAAFDIIVDSTTRMGNATYGLFGCSAALAEKPNPVLLGNLTGLSVGSHTFKVQWKSGIAAGFTVGDTTPFPSMYTMRLWEY